MLIIYADILFFINLIMDFLVLYVCSKVMNIPAKKIRLFFSSCIGGLYSIADIFMVFPEPAVAIVVSLVMCVTAFGFLNKIMLIKCLLMFYCAGFLAGGIITFLFNVFYTYRDTMLFSTGISVKHFTLFALLAYLIISVSVKFLSGMRNQKIKINAEITVMGKSKKYCFLCDSGNLLCDPYTGLPVIVISEKSIAEILNIREYIKCFSSSKADTAVKLKIRYIPVKTVAEKTVLPAFLPDKIILENNDGKRTEIKAVVAIMSQTLDNPLIDGVIPYSICEL